MNRFHCLNMSQIGVKGDSSGWGEIQELLQQTQQENTSMRHQLEALKQENRQLKFKASDIIGQDSRTDSEKAAMLGLEGRTEGEVENEKGDEEEVPQVSSPNQNGYVMVDNNGDPILPLFPSSSSEGSASFLCEDAQGQSDPNWDIHSSEEGSVACLQDRIQQMEENHYSVNEELQATLKELSDLQQSVTDLTFGNEKLTEDKGLILDALLFQLNKMDRLKDVCEYLKTKLSENGVTFNLDEFDDVTVEKTDEEGNVKDLANSDESRTRLLTVLREHSCRRELEEQKRNDKVNQLEQLMHKIFEEKKDLEQKGTVLRAKLASNEVELEKHRDMLEGERAKMVELFKHQDPDGKLNLELLLHSGRQEKEILELRCRELEEALNESNNHAEKLQLELERVEYQFEVSKQRFEEEMASYSEILRDQEAYKEELENEYSQMREACIELEDTCDTLDYDKHQHLKTIADLNQAIEVLRKEKQEMQRDLGDIKRTSAQDTAEWIQFQKDLQQTVKIANDYREEAQDEVKRLEKEKADLQDKVKSLTTELDRIKRDKGGRPSIEIPRTSRSSSLSSESEISKSYSNYHKSSDKDKPWISSIRKSTQNGGNVKVSVQNIIQNIEKEAIGDTPKMPSSPVYSSPSRESLSRRNSSSSSARSSLESLPGSTIRSHDSKLRRSATVQLPLPSDRKSSSPLAKQLKQRNLEDSPAPKETRRSVSGTRPTDFRTPVTRTDARQTISNVLFRRSDIGTRKAQTISTRDQGGPISTSKVSTTPSVSSTAASRRDSAEIKKDPLAALVNRYGGGGSKRNALLKWCQQKTQGYKGTDITNFSSSWNDGLAFCALLHNFLPSKIPYDDLSSQDKRKNFTLAFKAAESVGVPPILDIDDMVKMERPDWQSILAYVTSIYKKFGT
ncbi:Cytospin-A [Holothuria leucospilota]|uniref:Cytospin-A n=1 Tax=Holothuria leucospilota TaxID=206669 RepID=A0A9Q1CFV8_HOLLE|nr:Cytospin-A [Holothuria leucospilota]